MKAMILAAGLGTRLQPYSDHTPKSLFCVSNRPLLQNMITNLIDAGCEAVIINTHHLHQKIESFITRQHFAIPIQLRHEPKILGTGGAIRNVADFWDDRPFMVINADIVTAIDFKHVYNFHCQHPHPVTLVLTDDPELNSVVTNANGFVTGFHPHPCPPDKAASACLTFTGIQVLNPEVLKFISPEVPSSSIDAYTRMIASGQKIKAYVSENAYWKDIGTPQRYKDAVFEMTAPQVFKQVFPQSGIRNIDREPLKGDGSNRQWYRLKMGQNSMIMVDHGIKKGRHISEAEAFVKIGRHLFRMGLAVPQIYHEDTFAGYVFLEDLGSLHLQTAVQQTDDFEKIIRMYQTVILLLTRFAISGAQGFEAAWTYQTPRYSRTLILEHECRYFVEAFLNDYLAIKADYEDFKKEFVWLADNALKHAAVGFMHRDLQSRNIMIKNNNFYFIDFQGARMGPIQYDLASLLIDPYVRLPEAIQTQLLEYCIEKLSAAMKLNTENFRRCYRYCRLARNLQILGAFGYLTRVKSKAQFERYIPTAIKTLEGSLKKHKNAKFPKLKAMVDAILKHDRIQSLVSQQHQSP
jgi:NDP-sugar pyrophosphorylase family protein